MSQRKETIGKSFPYCDPSVFIFLTNGKRKRVNFHVAKDIIKCQTKPVPFSVSRTERTEINEWRFQKLLITIHEENLRSYWTETTTDFFLFWPCPSIYLSHKKWLNWMSMVWKNEWMNGWMECIPVSEWVGCLWFDRMNSVWSCLRSSSLASILYIHSFSPPFY